MSNQGRTIFGPYSHFLPVIGGLVFIASAFIIGDPRLPRLHRKAESNSAAVTLFVQTLLYFLPLPDGQEFIPAHPAHDRRRILTRCSALNLSFHNGIMLLGCRRRDECQQKLGVGLILVFPERAEAIKCLPFRRGSAQRQPRRSCRT